MTLVKMMLAAMMTASLALPVLAQDEGGDNFGGGDEPAAEANMGGAPAEGTDAATAKPEKAMKKEKSKKRAAKKMKKHKKHEDAG